MADNITTLNNVAYSQQLPITVADSGIRSQVKVRLMTPRKQDQTENPKYCFKPK